MTHTAIDSNHLPYLARLQHVGEHFTHEKVRLEHEMRYILGQSQRLESELVSFLQRSYGIDAQHVPFTLDTEHSVIVTPDPQDAATNDDPQEAPREPQE